MAAKMTKSKGMYNAQIDEDYRYFEPQVEITYPGTAKNSVHCPICQDVFETEAKMKHHFQTGKDKCFSLVNKFDIMYQHLFT